MKKPVFTGLSHVCIFVDDVMEAFQYYERILGAVPNQHIPHWKNKGFFQAGGFIEEAEEGEVSIGFMDVHSSCWFTYMLKPTSLLVFCWVIAVK